MKTIDVTASPFEGELRRDEKVVWVGQPDPNVLFKTVDLLVVPFSLLFGAFVTSFALSVFGIIEPLGGGKQPIPPSVYVLTSVFGIIGLYMIVGRFFYKVWRKKRTWYAVTNQRILIVNEGIQSKNVQSIEFQAIPSIHKAIRKDGIGTLRFGNASFPLMTMYDNTGLDLIPTGPEIPTFHDIPDAEEVYRMVTSARR